ncbi:MAG: gliding motility-associated C-terminal domain-containing protein [Bacteroidota bacterium]
MKKLIAIIFLFAVAVPSLASHFRAGEITYVYLGSPGPGQYKYGFYIIIYTNTCSTNTDDCEQELFFGDGPASSAMAPRINGPLPGPNDDCIAPQRMGEMVAACIKKNIYYTEHTYNAPSNYLVYMESYARNAGIVNIPNSGTAAFRLEAWLNINPFINPPNSSVQLNNPPIDEACFGQCFYHDAAPYDPDGDSLSFSLSACLGAGGNNVPFYFIPSGVSIDPVTGIFKWCSPVPNVNFPIPQSYNFAFIIHEWRKISGQWIKVGWVERDFQVEVDNCSNQPPQLATLTDTCITANQLLTFGITASDPDNDLLTLSGLGGTFGLNPDSSRFTTPAQPQGSPATGTFSWTPSCERVRSQPYLVSFKAIDNDGQVQLANYQSVMIYVLAPPVLNLSASSQCNNITLTWDAATCNPASNPLSGYRIYRKSDCSPWSPAVCETGVPAASGYTYAGTTTTTVFTDVNLSYGVSYSYIVIACYADGTESYASAPVCVSLRKEVPIITNVDVTSTSATVGTIDLRWERPSAGAAGLDTLAYPPPYRYDIYRKSGFTNPSQLSASITASAFYLLTATGVTDNNLNTADSAWCYRIDFYSGSQLICSSTPASSVYLSASPADNTVNLSWSFNTPWNNYLYEVYRFNGTSFVLIGSTAATGYTDDSLANGTSYCYKVKALGQYSDQSLPSPLVNWSEEKCAIPVDLVPPCAPAATVTADCELSSNALAWNNPNLSCADDVVAYNIYHTPVLNGDYNLIATVPSALITTYIDDSLTSIAGCYYVTAIDSFNNESPAGMSACADNCPEYALPNVFTPNGDGSNDLFIPFPYKYVKDIDLKIYNRWGDLVFTASDPDINWDGRHLLSKQLCSNGVYYYVCVVNEIHLEGIEKRVLTGFVHLIR